jgi:primosomal protein N' (replication factor Y) (superfamily II helicase)
MTEVGVVSPHIVRVALDTPIRKVFDYLAIPTMGSNVAAPGTRVRVPFGRRKLIGVVMDTAVESDIPPEKLKPVTEVLDAQPIFDASLLKLLTFAAAYYHHPVGEVAAAALPKLAREGANVANLTTCWFATSEGVAALDSVELRRARKQHALLVRIASASASASEGVPADVLATEFRNCRDTLRVLAKRGFVSSAEIAPAPNAAIPLAQSLVQQKAWEPSDEQHHAIERIDEALGTFVTLLLHGITGSGKTEVYLRAVETVLARGQNALVLVPEIGLTPQLVERFAARFSVPLAVMHSGLTDRERLDAWRRALSGDARIIIGTRSAVFSPVANLGLILIDEEHDSSFKQQDSAFRYSARDLAIVRAQQLGIPVVLGSATPSLETLHNAVIGRYIHLSLPRRAGQASPPRAATVDLRQHAVRQGLSTPAVEAMRRHLDEGGQVLVYINRRGYAPTLACTACGWCAPCRDCDAKLTVHLGANQLRCHHCGAQAPLPTTCPQCGYTVRAVGQGTERVEESLAELFPNSPIARLDRDVARKRGDIEAVVGRIASGEARILVGTQMVTKGHDFPNLTLVVVLNADHGLFSTDFRAPERLAQTIVQVAGRAGRAERAGEVLIQTEYPEHPLLQSLLLHGYEGFATAALEERQAARWPPFARLAALRANALALPTAIEFLNDARRLAGKPPMLQLLGPAPAAMPKRAARYHAQLLVECGDRAALHRFIAPWLERIESRPAPRDLRWSLDVDPLELF